MKEKTSKPADVGIIVGRFQSHTLHVAHIDLIKTVSEKHDKVMIFLGNSALRNTTNNPLDFRSRRIMINEEFPDIEILYIKDMRDDVMWSNTLDSLIADNVTPSQSVMLYGSRDSFLKSYSGQYQVCELESDQFISATEIRKRISNNYRPTVDYRAGMISATTHRYPTCYQTVDVAIFNNDSKLLLCRKPHELKYRFIGGFSDPRSNSLEEDVRREVKEEANIEINDIKYVCSQIIDDWRYAKEIDKIKTALFTASYLYGRPEGGDDVAEVKWFDINLFRNESFVKETVVPEHIKLLLKLL